MVETRSFGDFTSLLKVLVLRNEVPPDMSLAVVQDKNLAKLFQPVELTRPTKDRLDQLFDAKTLSGQILSYLTNHFNLPVSTPEMIMMLRSRKESFCQSAFSEQLSVVRTNLRTGLTGEGVQNLNLYQLRNFPHLVLTLQHQEPYYFPQILAKEYADFYQEDQNFFSLLQLLISFKTNPAEAVLFPTLPAVPRFVLVYLLLNCFKFNNNYRIAQQLTSYVDSASLSVHISKLRGILPSPYKIITCEGTYFLKK